MNGQISIFDWMKDFDTKNLEDPIRQPCGRRCKHEWGSRNCFEARGQMYNWHERKWVRDADGKILIGKKTCDWEPKERRTIKHESRNLNGTTYT